tara:strand:- start:6030 stop:8513 length:2484 start_codon:yes stop_codon:yes gene_type:complete
MVRWSVVLAFLPVLVQAELPQRTRMPKAKLEPFLKENCVKCHGPDKQKGQVRFDEVSWEITNNDTAQRWQDVLDVLNGGEMPPEDEPQPSDAELSRILDTLTGALLKARMRLTDHGGEIKMRRLNQREYANTITELFGFKVPLHMVPEDGESEAFDTVGADQFFTSSHFEKYLELGKVVAANGFQWSGKPHQRPTKNSREAEERVTERLRTTLADLDKKMEMKLAGATWQEMGFKDEGEAKIIFSQFKNRAGKPRQYLEYPLVDTGMYVVDATNETKRFGMNRGIDPRARYEVKVRAGIVGDPPEIRKFLRFSDNAGPIGVVKVQGTAEEPQTVGMSVEGNISYRVMSFHVEENRADIRVLDSYLKRLDPGGQWASIWIDRLEMEGPFYDRPLSFFGNLIYPEGYVRGKRSAMMQDASARELIQRFAFEAFRRKEASPEFVGQLVTIFENNRSSGMKYEEAMGEVIGIILSSPGFLFLQEASEESGEKRQLDEREFAVRLAYFLWSRPPDAELYQCAKDKTLFQPKVLKAQVDRMLDDPKSASFMDGFASQWAELPRFNAITVDEQAYFRFNAGVRLSAYQEVAAFFGELVKENLPISNLIDSDFVVINSVLGEHYDIPGADSDEFRRVSLPEGSPRGGLLGQTAFLTLGSNGERSSPVIRGALVMEKLLHDKPAPPPPNVPELGTDNKKPSTNRQLVELHQNQAVCASCHRKMDVIGFGLENFDVIGKWRTTEKVGRRDVAIEPGGTLPDGAAFSDLEGLKSVLLSHEADLAQEMVESMLAYGLGRTIEFSDETVVLNIIERLAKDRYPTRAMIHEIAASKLFRTK